MELPELDAAAAGASGSTKQTKPSNAAAPILTRANISRIGGITGTERASSWCHWPVGFTTCNNAVSTVHLQVPATRYCRIDW